jgi:hypothetical protein
MMGSSVNLAARLMGKAANDEIFVSGDVYKSSTNEFKFTQLPSVKVSLCIVTCSYFSIYLFLSLFMYVCVWMDVFVSLITLLFII